VTRRRCVVCERKLTAKRRGARYCSGACHQRATRARARESDLERLEREIDAAKAHYWALVQQMAEARGVQVSQVVTEQAQFVDEDGNVSIRDRLVGKTTPHRPGWASWGLEAAGPPFSPPIRRRRSA
jgi:hypothetical protein